MGKYTQPKKIITFVFFELPYYMWLVGWAVLWLFLVLLATGTASLALVTNVSG